MQIEAIMVKRFRSIEQISLVKCGTFNVLIGRNNAGKSTILASIDHFFRSIQRGVLDTSPLIGRESDYFSKQIEEPIEITLIFSLLLAERDKLIRDIVTQAPQVKNAADGLDPSLNLAITLSVRPTPSKYSYISRIDLVSKNVDHSWYDIQRPILEISLEAAEELRAKLVRKEQLTISNNYISKALSRSTGTRPDMHSWFQRTGTERPPLRYFPEFGGISTNNVQYTEIESSYMKSNSFEDFESQLLQFQKRNQTETHEIDESPLKNRIDTFAGQQTSIPNYAITLINNLSEIKILHLGERRAPIGKAEAEKLLNLKVTRGGPEVLRGIQQTVSALLGVNIDAFQVSLVDEGERSRAEMDVDNFLVQANGSGIREALRIILDYEFNHPQVLLVEEPEICLHPSLETSMMRYLKRVSSFCQVFISTHSTNFLDTSELKNVYLVSKPISTQVQLLDIESAESQIPKELGIRLSSLFMYDRLVFVEGPTDEAIFRELASKIGVDFGKANVGFVTMGGVRNFAYFAAESTLSFLTKRQVTMWFILDHDEKDEAEIDTFRKRIGAWSHLCVLKKRELENYLIQPEAIKEFIGLKRSLMNMKDNTKLPSLDELKKKLNENADGLKQLAIDKRLSKVLCVPIYYEQKRIFSGSGSVARNIKDEIEKHIKDLEIKKDNITFVEENIITEFSKDWQFDKLSVVPGDILLDKVCSEYGVRYKKDLDDGARLASCIKDANIDKDLRAIIQEIVG
jgi:putative ATP-dependent endonuclease of the OLD family